MPWHPRILIRVYLAPMWHPRKLIDTIYWHPGFQFPNAPSGFEVDFELCVMCLMQQKLRAFNLGSLVYSLTSSKVYTRLKLLLLIRTTKGNFSPFFTFNPLRHGGGGRCFTPTLSFSMQFEILLKLPKSEF